MTFNLSLDQIYTLLDHPNSKDPNIPITSSIGTILTSLMSMQ